MASIHYLFALVFLIQGSSSFVTLEQNGFKGFYVFISPSVDQKDWNGIKAGLAKAFEKTSATMYYATGSRSYFSEFNVILPREWKDFRAPDGFKHQNDLESEMVIQNSPISLYSNLPYVDHSRVCNANGDMMQFPSSFFNNWQDTETYVGDIDKLMLKLWSNYRYGMFDELGYPQDEKYPAVYCKAGSLSVTQCSNVPLEPAEEKYVSIRGNNQDCLCNGREVDARLNCVYLPGDSDAQNDGLFSSLMGFHHIWRIQTWCDTESNFYFHDFDQPNLQNILCKKPTMDVMMEHYDFQNGHNPPAFIDDLVPKTYVYKLRTDIVFVLDTNGNILKDTGTMVKSMLSEWMEENAMFMHVGIIAISGLNQNYTDIYDIQQITTTQDIDNIKKDIGGIKYSGQGSRNLIEGGLRRSIEILENAEKGIVVLISDGSENKGNMLKDDLKKQFQNKNIRIVAIDISEKGNNNLKSLSEVSNQAQGMYFFAGPQSLKVYDAMATAARTFSYPHPSKKVKILSSMEPIALFSIDASLERVEITFYLLSPIANDKIKIRLSKNGGKTEVIPIDSANLPKVIKTITVAPADVGDWYYDTTDSPASCFVGVDINGITKEGSDVMSVDCQVVPTKIDGRTKNMRILAKPLENNMPIVDASVYAVIEGRTNKLELMDDGITNEDLTIMDAIGADGVYTAVIPSEIPKGKIIKCVVEGKTGNTGKTFAHLGFKDWYDKAFGKNIRRPLCCGSKAPPPTSVLDENYTGLFRRIAFSNYYSGP